MKTILIADDDIITRKILKNMCQDLGYKVLETDNGEKALKMLGRRQVEILISDWIMPKLDGVSLCEKIRHQPNRKAPFFFLITGKKKGLSDFAEAREAGVDDFLYKPVDYFVFRNQLRVAEEALYEKEESGRD